MAILTRPITNFGETITELRPTRRRLGADIRDCGELGKNEDAKRIRLIENLCGLARGGGRQLLAADIWATWAEMEGFGDVSQAPTFPITLKHPVPLPGPDGRKVVVLIGPSRPVLGEDMIAAGECGANEDAKSLVYTEHLCTGQDSAGVAVPLTAKIVDAMDGEDCDQAWSALVPFFSGIPGPRTSASDSPPSS